MLQQTRVETVLPYYGRFMDRFPTVEALATAGVDEVLALWSGLGYYRRARQLHAAARWIAARGSFPSSARELRDLPGIGEYTAAAIASMAFGEAVPVVDGNVRRVLARLLGLRDPWRAVGRRRLVEAAAGFLDPARAGDSNQALMELGATVCTPRRPACGRCPVEPGCAAARTGQPEGFPAPRPRPVTRRVRGLIALVRDREWLLFFRRPADARLLAGTWELPWVELGDADPPAAALARRYGGRWRLGDPLARVRHSITSRRLDLEVRWAELEDAGMVAEGVEASWWTPGEIAHVPASSMVAKALALLR